jgi:hypothetical protein
MELAVGYVKLFMQGELGRGTCWKTVTYMTMSEIGSYEVYAYFNNSDTFT